MRVALYSWENCWLFSIFQVTLLSDLIIPRNWQKWFYIWKRHPSGRKVVRSPCNHIYPQLQKSRKDPWLAKVQGSWGAQDLHTEPVSAGYRVFIQPSQWRLQEPSTMFIQEKPRRKVRTCKSNPLVLAVLIFPGQEAPVTHRLIWSLIIIKLSGLVFFRIKWPELLSHPFWAQVRTEEEDPEVHKDSGDEYSEGKNTREAFGSAGSRCVCIKLFLCSSSNFLQAFCSSLWLCSDVNTGLVCHSSPV